MKNIASINQIAVFVRIAELGSLSAAARELHLSPSAVSKSLAQLEERLGVLLVRRTTRSLTLTDSGRIIFERANDILSDLETTLDAARDSNSPEGNLRITCSMAFGSSQLTPAVAKYLEAHDKVTASVELSDRLVNLAEENFDLAIRITGRTDSAYAARRLATIRWVYCASPSYLKARENIIEPEDLKNHRCLVYPEMTVNGRWSFTGMKGDLEIQVDAAFESNSSLAVHEATRRGLGVACMPTYLVSSDIVDGRLKVVLPDYRAASTHTLYAMYYRSKYANPLVRSFIDFLVAEFGQLPPWDGSLEKVSPPR